MTDNTQSTTEPSMEMPEDFDASLENDLNPDAPQPDAMNLDGANDVNAPNGNGITDVAPSLEARIPAKKDATLREFLGKMDDYAPIVSLTSERRCWNKLLTNYRSLML